MSLILHVGWPKNATSFLQTFFAKNIKELRQKGIIYPEIFDLSAVKTGNYGQGNGFSLAYNLLSDKSITRCIYPEYDLLELESTLKEFKSSQKILISSEWFTELSESKLQKIKKTSEITGHKVTIIAYLRPLLSFLESEYAQGIKQGSIAVPFEQWEHKIDYQDKLNRFEKVFGESNIIIRPFLRDKWKSSAIEIDFLHQLGVKVTKERFSMPKAVNVSLDAKILQLQRLLSGYSFAFSELDILLLQDLIIKNKVIKSTTAGSWISETKANELLVHYGESLSKIDSKYFKDDESFLLSRNDKKLDNVLYEDLSVDEIKSIVNHILVSPLIKGMPAVRRSGFYNRVNVLQSINSVEVNKFLDHNGLDKR